MNYISKDGPWKYFHFKGELISASTRVITIKCIALLSILLSLCLKFKLLQIIDLYSTLLVLHRRYVCYLMNHDGNSHKNLIAVDLEKPDTIKQI